MKKTLPIILATLFLGACSGWFIQPGSIPTPFLPPTNTPAFVSATPVVIGVASLTATPQVVIPTSTPITFITATLAPTFISIPSATPGSGPTQTSLPGIPAISVEILGCNTSVDVSHGMGEVTNAYIVLKNTGGVDLTNLKATLNALDEGRVHPDKTVEVSLLPVGYKVTLKLTVDSTYRAETPIQVEVTGDPGLFQRVGAAACKDIGLFAPNPDALKTPVPGNP